ncbi:hypothetical protein G7K71_09380 [Desulfofundulus sp. TPOSR]|uniref:PD40 domain-containing protein n=1 Tax=Desulfofundulus sp. TPOSR TaxID=2714340 RepID=UPI00140A9CD6|nr:PD40 domain-containing protein [Desulfofundulus sp. TPOSR]NHM27192.1 hypothetical protein [Desulfofundulus sp. TPOSR]
MKKNLILLLLIGVIILTGCSRDIQVKNSDRKNLSSKQENKINKKSLPSKIAFVKNDTLYIMNEDGTLQEPLVSNVSDKSRPSWSPDGSKILYTIEEQEDTYGLYILNVSDKTQKRISDVFIPLEPPPSFREAVWSPDGTKIVFLKLDKSDQNVQLHLIDLKDLKDTTLVKAKDLETKLISLHPTLPHIPNSFAWSPDGKTIAFSLASFIFTVNNDGSDLKIIKDMKELGYCVQLIWAKNKIIFAVNRNEPYEKYGVKKGFTPDIIEVTSIFIMNSYGNGIKKLGEYVVFRGFALSPDGEKIAIAGKNNYDSDQFLYIINLIDETQVSLKNDENYSNYSVNSLSLSPCWSPDGSKIAFVKNTYQNHTSARVSVVTDMSGIFVVSSNGQNETQILNAEQGFPYPLTWSP